MALEMKVLIIHLMLRKYFEIRHQGEPVDPADWFRR